MKYLKSIWVIAGFFCVILSTAAQQQSGIRFDENKGQWPEEVLYRAWIPSGKMYLVKNGIVFDLFESIPHAGVECLAPTRPWQRRVIRLEFVGRNETFKTEAEGPASDVSNYFIGNDPRHWQSDVRNFQKVIYRQVYPGIDFIITGGDILKTEFIVQPGANPSKIKMKVSGADLRLQNEEIWFLNDVNDLKEQKPFAFQSTGGDSTEVECSFTLKSETISYEVGKFDRKKELIIDPYLVFSTYSGSAADNWGFTACFDSLGNAISGGIVNGTGYPVSNGSFDGTYNASWDVAIIKYDSTGTQRMWATYLGGNSSEMPHSMIVDSDDNLIILGTTGSPDFPVHANAYDYTFNGGSGINYLNIFFQNGTDIFLFKLSQAGNLMLGSTFLGGSENDGINFQASDTLYSLYGNGRLYYNYGDGARGEVIVDENDKIYVASCTFSSDFPTTASFQLSSGGLQEGVIFCLNPLLSSLNWSTYLGGSGNDAIYSLDIDPSGNVVFAGGTESTNIIYTDSIFASAGMGGPSDGILGKIHSSGSNLLNLLRFGSTHYDQIYFVKTDQSGDVFITGQCDSSQNALIYNALYNHPNSGQFIARLASDFKTLKWSTVFGLGDGNPDISPTAFAVDLYDKIYLSGWGRLGIGGVSNWTTFQGIKNMEVTPGAFQTVSDGMDFYLMILSTDGNCLRYATFFGETHYNTCSASGRDHVDGGTSRFDKRGYIYQSVCASCGGCDNFPTFPSGNVWSSTNNSANCNNALFKFELESLVELDPVVVCNGESAQLGPDLLQPGVTYLWKPSEFVSNAFIPNPLTQNITQDTTLTLFTYKGACVDSMIQKVYSEYIQVDIPADLAGCEGDTFAIQASVLQGSGSYYWYDDPSLVNPIESGTLELTIPVVESNYLYFVGYTPHCEDVDSVWIQVSNVNPQLNPGFTICKGDSILIQAQEYPGQTIVYTWQPDSILISGQGTSQGWFYPEVEQEIWINMVNNGCSDSASAYLTFSDLSQYNGELIQPTSDTIYETQWLMLSVQMPFQAGLFWSPDSLFSNPFAPQVEVSPTATSMIYLVAEDEFGCQLIDSVEVVVLKVYCDEGHVFIPTGFSPNADQKNDVLFVRTEMGIDIEWDIFSRWGEKIFSSNSTEKGWDGTYKGQEMDPGVYIYQLKLTCWNGEIFQTAGNVTLIR